MLIHAAAHSDAFKAVVSEGGSGQSIRDHFENTSTLDAIMGYGPVTAATAIFTSTLPPASLKSEVAKIAPNAVFLVYGENGQGGSEEKPNKLLSRRHASRSRSGRSRTASTSPGSPPSRPSTSAA